jgi:hypothetical protein
VLRATLSTVMGGAVAADGPDRSALLGGVGETIRAGYIEVHFRRLQARRIIDPRREIEERIFPRHSIHRWTQVVDLLFAQRA